MEELRDKLDKIAELSEGLPFRNEQELLTIMDELIYEMEGILQVGFNDHMPRPLKHLSNWRKA